MFDLPAFARILSGEIRELEEAMYAFRAVAVREALRRPEERMRNDMETGKLTVDSSAAELP